MATATDYVHHCFRAAMFAPSFPCLGAKAALRRGAYRFGLYPALGSPEAATWLARDLVTFLGERQALCPGFQSYVASFTGPPPSDETRFEACLWEQVQRLHDLDGEPWDAAVSADPADPEFSFSFAGTAFFVVGLHPASSRRARRFAWPTLVFNPHDQFARLREQGRFLRLRDAIRRREIALQGSLNPNVSDHGTESEARQYSGRPAEPEWKCPFHPREP
ncbi:MAG: YqcI/YcgG family protein [Gemmatimonadota bacterium]|nr:YqcI/YcgG family protein [Gemmatimonadota bacterium]